MGIIGEVELLPLVLRTPGVYESTGITLPDVASYATVVIGSGNEWVNPGVGGHPVDVAVEIEQGGLWINIGSCTTEGIAKRRKDGVVSSETTLMVRLPLDRVVQPMLRGVLRCSRACTTALVVRFYDDPVQGREVNAHHSVTYDNDNETTATNVTSITLASFVVGNNANRCLMVGVCGYDSVVGDNAVTGVTWNGSATGAALVISRTLSDGGAGADRSTIWRVLAPAVATASAVITFAGTAAEAGMHVLSVYDVHQTTPTAGQTGADGLSGTITVNVGSVAADDMVYDMVYSGASSASVPAAGAGQTSRASNVIAGNSYRLASTEVASGTVTMSWTRTNQTDWCQVACAIKASAAVAGYTPQDTMFMQAVNRASTY